MKDYLARFFGRTNGAIGIRYNIETHVSGKNKEDARIKLYDRFEHISELELLDTNKSTNQSLEHDMRYEYVGGKFSTPSAF